MNLAQAIEHASTLFVPEFLFGFDEASLNAERETNEQAIKMLHDEWFANDNPSFSYDLVRELADRNRVLCDSLGAEAIGDTRSVNLARSLSDNDVLRGIAALQHRRPETILKEIQRSNATLGVAYAAKSMKGTVLGIDIETSSREPDRGYIINVGFELMNLSGDDPGEPYDPVSAYCGMPDQYAEVGVPLQEIHQITWDDIKDATAFREDKALQEKLVKLMSKHPYMAHNAAFEDAWFTLHLDGYAEARKAGKVVPIDTRNICRELDPEVRKLPFDSHPAALENWARRRGTLAASEAERHLGLDDADLMLRTVYAEFLERNIAG